MSTVLVIVHVLVCVFLIAVVLLQRGRGAEIGAVFGGGASSTVFGSRGAGNFLTKLTTISAVVFMLTSMALSYIWTSRSEDKLFQDGTATEAPAAPAAPQESPFQEVPAPAEQPPAPAAGANEAREPGSLPPLNVPQQGSDQP